MITEHEKVSLRVCLLSKLSGDLAGPFLEIPSGAKFPAGQSNGLQIKVISSILISESLSSNGKPDDAIHSGIYTARYNLRHLFTLRSSGNYILAVFILLLIFQYTQMAWFVGKNTNG